MPGGASPSRLPCSFSCPGCIRIRALRPIKAGCDARTLASDVLTVQGEISGWETDGYTLEGVRGKICARQTCRYEGQTAAHGQITERKPSVARMRFLILLHEGGRVRESRNAMGPCSIRPSGRGLRLIPRLHSDFQSAPSRAQSAGVNSVRREPRQSATPEVRPRVSK
jgi:hypothetical protein